MPFLQIYSHNIRKTLVYDKMGILYDRPEEDDYYFMWNIWQFTIHPMCLHVHSMFEIDTVDKIITDFLSMQFAPVEKYARFRLSDLVLARSITRNRISSRNCCLFFKDQFADHKGHHETHSH